MKEKPEQIRSDYLNGMTYKAIAEKYQIDQRTAKRYVEQNLPLSQLDHRPYASILDPYEPMIRSMLADGPVFAKTVYLKLREAGYPGGYTIVNRRVRQIIQENESAGLYPPYSPRSGKLASADTEIPSIADRIREENDYVRSRIQQKHK